jgi:uncharacterized membrane protein YeaQ/YmgE (transglycosylase-associated protein family)
MNIPIWIIAGAVVGWIGCAMLNVNEKRGLALSIVVGAVAGFFGGNVLAPMLGAAVDIANDFSGFSLLIAMGTAAGCLMAGNLLDRRYGT